jgi:hypothetical protein
MPPSYDNLNNTIGSPVKFLSEKNKNREMPKAFSTESSPQHHLCPPLAVFVV